MYHMHSAHLNVDGCGHGVVVAGNGLLHVQVPGGAEVELALEHLAAVGVGVELISTGHVGLKADL